MCLFAAQIAGSQNAVGLRKFGGGGKARGENRVQADGLIFGGNVVVIGQYADGGNAGKTGQIPGDGRNLVVIFPRHKGNPDFHCRTGLIEVAEIVQNQPVGLPGAAKVDVLVQGFQIVQKQIGVGQHRVNGLPGDKAAGVNGGVNPVFLHGFQDFPAGGALHQAFSAGEGDAAAAFRVEIPILQQRGAKRPGGGFLAQKLQRLAGADGGELLQLPVVFVGYQEADLPEWCRRTEMYGWSFYGWDYSMENPTGATHRICGFVQAYTGNVLREDATEEQKRHAVELAGQMKDFPEEGSVLVTEDCVVVRLSEVKEQMATDWW